MVSTWMMYLLLIQNIAICLFGLFEGQYQRATYWFGAALINFSLVYWGIK
jgi:hypothetical protein